MGKVQGGCISLIITQFTQIRSIFAVICKLVYLDKILANIVTLNRKRAQGSRSRDNILKVGLRDGFIFPNPQGSRAGGVQRSGICNLWLYVTRSEVKQCYSHSPTPLPTYKKDPILNFPSPIFL